MVEQLGKVKMLEALSSLDEILVKKRKSRVTLIVGGGGAMILAHGFPLGTYDIDAYPKGMNFEELTPFVEEVGRKLHIPADWLNPWFSTFAHTLPQDYSDRLISVYAGQNLDALALGKDEMLIMKCFAGRQKDVSHAKTLVKGGADTKFVIAHLEKLAERRIPGSEKAIEFLEDILCQV